MNQKAFSPIVIVLGIAVILALIGGAYYFGKSSSNQISTSYTVPTQTQEITTSPKATIKPSSNATSSATSQKNVTIPTNWKAQTAYDPYYGVKTTISLPSGFKFVSTGSEIMIQSDDSQELWRYIPSTDVIDGVYRNTYKGESRRDWYAKLLKGDFAPADLVNKKSGEILNVVEHPINNTSYLEITVDELGMHTGKHFIFEQNGIIHTLVPSAEKSYTASAQIPQYMDQIFASLKSIKAQ